MSTSNDTPIAIVGMGCRLPGGVNSPEEFWAALLAERDLVSEVPVDRWDVGPLYDPTPGKAGRTVSRWGGFLDDVAGFDAEFFGVTPREAVWLDPQQRLLLEVGYEALEDAGIPLERIAGSDCGVFVGQSAGDYWSIMEGDNRRFSYYGMTGAWARSVMSGRLSFAFDLRGPTLSIDTACSSGLAALDVAVRYLRSGGPMAMVGAVNVTLIADGSIIYSGNRMLSAEGRCKFGDADADGFVRSEAVGVVVLEPLDTALANGDPVAAIVLGSANGSDGRDGGLLVRPGPDGQRRVIERACRDAGIDPADVDFVEAHGPGTQAGDPVELTTLGEVLGTGRPAERPLLVTSAKTNIGHAECAAGVVGVIKAVLCLKNQLVPASLHLNRPSPAIPWETLPLRIVRSATPLPDTGRPALAGVNSFGISGNSAHVVLSAAPTGAGDSDGADRNRSAVGRPEALLLSAAGPEALLGMAARWAQFLESTDLSFTDVCHSAAVRRTHHPFRLAAVADSSADAVTALRGYVAGLPGSVTVAESGPRPQVAFVFPGQGCQWAAMGRNLLSDEPVYAAAFDECGAAIADEIGVSIRKLIEAGSDEWLTRTEVVQPTLWAVQVALAALWRSWGVEPDAVIGHSMGEVAAACVAGALSIGDGAAVICRRSALAARLRGRGAMAWTELTAAQVEQAVAGRDVVAAAFNGPNATVLSGDTEAVSDLVAELEERGTVARLIKVDFASHCPQIDEITDDLLTALKGCVPGQATVPIRSTLLGRLIDGTELDAAYWARNIREPVEFTGAVQDQLACADTIFLEISAHPLLTTTIRAHGPTVRAFGSLRRQAGEREALLSTLAELHVAGTPIDWSAVTAGGCHVPLPRYPWQHQHYWLPPAEEPVAQSPRTAAPALHPLLGTVEVSEEDGCRQWTGKLDVAANGYLLDHCVQAAAILPGTGYLDLIAAAARRIYGPVPLALAEVRYLRAIFLDPTEVRELRVTARPDGSACRVTVHSRTVGETEWALHVEAIGRPESIGAKPESGGLAQVHDAKARCAEHQSGPEFYAHHAARGNQWNTAFQGLVEVWRGQDEAVARVRLSELAKSQPGELFHPTLLDSCAQAIAAARPEVAASADAAFVLRSVGAYRLYRLPGPGELWSHASLLPGHAAESCVANVRIYDDDGLVAEIDDMCMHYLMGRAPDPAPITGVDSPAMVSAELRDWLYRQEWVVAERHAEEVAAGGRWLVFQDSGHVGRDVVETLRQRGHEVVTVTVAATHAHSDDDRLRFQADPARPQDIVAVVSAACAGGPLRGVVYLWGLDATRSSEPTGWELERTLNLGCTGVAQLARALEQITLSSPPRLWLVTRGSQHVTDADSVTGLSQAPVWGLGPALAGEQPSLRTTLIDLDERDSTVAPLVRELLTADNEDRIALRGSTRFVARLCRAESVAADPTLALAQPEPGVLAGLRFTGDAQPTDPQPDQVLIRAEYAGLNFRDVLRAAGAYPGQDDTARLGLECAGTVTAIGADVRGLAVGDQVAAIAEGAFSTHVLSRAELAVRPPSGLAPAQAATMPIAFATAYHALHVLGRVQPGDRVLIHTASGGVGLASIQVARWLGARVYGTCGLAKHDALAEFGLEGVADSRSLAYVDQFRAATAGHGFDVIVNTLVGDRVTANLSLLAPRGRYIELAKRDIANGAMLPMDAFQRNRSFHALDIVDLARTAPQVLGETLRAVFAGYERGDFLPLRSRQFDAGQVVDAMQQMTRAQHVGKLVIALPQPAHAGEPAAGKRITSSGTHLLTGGLGGLGGRLAHHLVDAGARDLVMLGRGSLSSEPNSPGPVLLRELRSRGAQVDYHAVDVADTTALTALLAARRAAGAAPVRAVYHLAGVLDQCAVADLDADRLAAGVRAKFAGGWALHHAVETEPVEHFVLFSSGSSVLSSPTCGAYAAGNAFLDALARHRRAKGLPATLLNWGYWQGVGMVAWEKAGGRDMTPRGMAMFAPEDALLLLDALLDRDVAEAVVLRVDWPAWSAAYPTAAHAPLLRSLIDSTPVAAQPPPAPARPHPRLDVSAPVAAQAAEDVGETVIAVLLGHLTRVLGLRPDRIRRDRSLIQLGVDSLTATELRNLIEHRFGVSVRIVDMLRNGTTPESLARLIEASAADRV